MSSAKAALESDTKVLAYEAGRKFQVRVNTISAGPLGSRAAKAIGFIEDMIRWGLFQSRHLSPCRVPCASRGVHILMPTAFSPCFGCSTTALLCLPAVCKEPIYESAECCSRLFGCAVIGSGGQHCAVDLQIAYAYNSDTHSQQLTGNGSNSLMTVAKHKLQIEQV